MRRHLSVGLATAAIVLLAGGAVTTASTAPPTTDTATRLVVATTVAPITSIVANIVGDRADDHGHRPGGHELAHLRAPAERRRAAVEGRRRLRQRAEARGADRRSWPRRTSTTAPRSSSSGRRRSPRSQYIYDFSFPRPAASPTRTCGPTRCSPAATPRSSRDDTGRARPGERRLLPRQLSRRSRAMVDRARRRDADVVRHDSRARKLLTYHDAYAYFARDYGWEVHRRDPGVRLRGPDAAGGRRPDRAGPASSTCRRSSARRCSRARCSSRSARRPAPSTSTTCATTTCPAHRASPSTPGSG